MKDSKTHSSLFPQEMQIGASCLVVIYPKENLNPHKQQMDSKTEVLAY